ncbi:hypothetical protein BU16DRAFT_453839 [Lophium mytilinum]|uniref:Uncharacterized protein n=1 Tax=Lophium mytilinum TaxID=390894 RepID=A0A6A6R5J7_9PEZI|nr:hypothetical protein BU16DRAFT_453839 [Lophium mytilinum]
MPVLLEYLTIEEEAQIYQQFEGICQPNSQVLWSGVPYGVAQKWADEHDMQTLTTAMGPLMDKADSLCLKKSKNGPQWSKYIKGASAVFAWYISSGEKVTTLSPPPPERFHPSGMTNYQAIEEPILKWAIADRAILRIEMVHPTVKGAENFSYQMWPIDEMKNWVAAFGTVAIKKNRWRVMGKVLHQMAIRKSITTNEKSDVGHSTSHYSQESELGMRMPIVREQKKVS